MVPTLGQGQNLNSLLPENFAAIHSSPDPLLHSGSYIETNAQAPVSRDPNRGQQSAESPPSKGAPAGLNTNVSNCPEHTESSNGRRVRKTPTAMEPLSWLPPGWRVEDRVRTSGAKAGAVDKFYFDPSSGRQFRSKKEVLYFLETGTVRKKKRAMENSDADTNCTESSESNKYNKSSMKTESTPLNFDFANAPDKISWVLTDASRDTWSPFIGGDERVPESSKQAWATAFASLTTRNGGMF